MRQKVWCGMLAGQNFGLSELMGLAPRASSAPLSPATTLFSIVLPV